MAENAIGLTAGGNMVWLNRFTPPAGDFPMTLVSAEVMFRAADNIPLGFAYDVFVYYDTDNNPGNGATHIGSAVGQTVSVLDAFQVTTFAVPVAIPAAGDVLILVRANHVAGQFPAAIDQTATQTRSWIGLGAGAETTPPTVPTATFGEIGSFGFAGNWLIRGTYTTGGGGGGTTFCSGSLTDMPGGQPATTAGPFAPYPNTIAVSGVTGTVTDVNVRFMGTNHTFPDDLDIFVQGPLGGTAILMSDAGGSIDMVAVDITFDDEAATPIPDATAITTGSYQGANYGVGDIYDAPAPAPDGNTLLSVYDGLDPNGTWNLWGDDDLGGDSGFMTDWCVDFTVDTGGPIINTYPSTDTPLPIADGSGTNVPGPPTVSTITVPANPNIVLDVDVQLTVTHTWAGDVAATLTHPPSGASSTIFDRPGVPATTFGCPGDNPTLTIDDEGTGGTVEGSCVDAPVSYPPGVSYTPNTPLSVFDGLDVEGTWVLTVTDNAGGDTGTLTSWTLILTKDIDTSAPQGPGAAEASLRVLPNPMSSAGTVELTVPTSQDVRVAVYDMLGREVMVLFEGSLAASQSAYISVAAGRLDAGVYVVRATGEDFQTIQRVTIAR